MKSKLFVFVMAALLVFVMAIPTFAAIYPSIEFTDGLHVLSDKPTVGEYYLVCEFTDMYPISHEITTEIFSLVEQDDNPGSYFASFVLSCDCCDYSGRWNIYIYQVDDRWIIESEDCDGSGEYPLFLYELHPVASEPATAEELTDSFDHFFSGVVEWFDSLLDLMQEPLVLLSVFCIPLTGVIVLLITKSKDL